LKHNDDILPSRIAVFIVLLLHQRGPALLGDSPQVYQGLKLHFNLDLVIKLRF